MMYTYECLLCTRLSERVMPASEYTPTVTCEYCGAQAARVFLPNRLPQVSVLQSFVTSDITGEPVEITSRRKEKALCDRHGLEPVGAGHRTARRKPVEMPTTIQDDYEKLHHEVGDPSGDRAIDLVLGRK